MKFVDYHVELHHHGQRGRIVQIVAIQPDWYPLYERVGFQKMQYLLTTRLGLALLAEFYFAGFARQFLDFALW